MTHFNINSAIAQSTALLSQYGFELGGYTAKELVTEWLTHYQANWIRLAVIEALYQGRYKAVSIEQILSFWARRQDVSFHFSHEFERMICRKLPRNLALLTYPSPETSSQETELSWELEMQDTETPTTDLSSTPPQQLPLPVTPQLPQPFSWKKETLSLGQRPQDSLPSSQKSSNHEETQENEVKTEKGDELSENESPPEINQFTPSPDGSRFYSKLKAVAQDNAPSNGQNPSTPFQKS